MKKALDNENVVKRKSEEKSDERRVKRRCKEGGTYFISILS
jgi:hypothetical protein